MFRKLVVLMGVSWPMMASPNGVLAAIVGVGDVELNGSILVSATTEDGFTVTAEELTTGTTSAPGGWNAENPPEMADNFDLSNATSNGYPLTTVDFNGRKWVDSNGDLPDFFLFESGGNDAGDIQAVFPDGSLGQPLHFTTEDWASTGYPGLWGTQIMHGLAFAITDLLDAEGNPLTNSTVIQGLHLTNTGVDPAIIAGVAAPPIVHASEPMPADGAMGVITPMFQWTAGDTAVFHDVYLGTSPDLGPADLAQPRWLLPMYYHAAGLTPEQTYYWRVDEIEADMVTVHTGTAWSFTAAPATAYAPSPWDGARGIDPEADLSWTGGVGAISHDVYFGTDAAAVEARDAGTFKGNQVAVTFDPGTLAENTTYHWLVDERDTAQTLYEGGLWSFTTLAPTDGVKAQYFSGTTLSGEPLLTQVEDSIDHAWGQGEIVAGLSDAVSARWTAILEAPFTETFTLITTSDDGVRLWLDGHRLINNWANHGTTDDRAEVDLVAGQTYSLQLEWYENDGGAVARLSWSSPSIARQVVPAGALQLPLKAQMPAPANGAVDVSQDVILGWSAGDEATGHYVYFGDDEATVAGAATGTQQAVDNTIYYPGVLEWGKTYYWRIDEASVAGAVTGSVWRFTTADFLIVEDFESYDDDIDGGTAIFQTWVDGVDNGTGSYVGYEVANGGTFGETSIVNGGVQSMPLDYNNVNAPYYSETERTFVTPENWTVDGVDTLVIHIRGRAGNDAEPLYVGIEDSAGRAAFVAAPDAAMVTATSWTPWKVPLSEFSVAVVNLTAVKKMIIGLGDRNAPTPGGAGLIYVDDIRVTKPESAE